MTQILDTKSTFLYSASNEFSDSDLGQRSTKEKDILMGITKQRSFSLKETQQLTEFINKNQAESRINQRILDKYLIRNQNDSRKKSQKIFQNQLKLKVMQLHLEKSLEDSQTVEQQKNNFQIQNQEQEDKTVSSSDINQQFQTNQNKFLYVKSKSLVNKANNKMVDFQNICQKQESQRLNRQKYMQEVNYIIKNLKKQNYQKYQNQSQKCQEIQKDFNQSFCNLETKVTKQSNIKIQQKQIFMLQLIFFVCAILCCLFCYSVVNSFRANRF